MWEVLCSVRPGGSEIGSTVTATADSALATSVDELARANVGVHQLEDFVSVWATQRASFAWFLGAGVSASAGVPTAKPRSTDGLGRVALGQVIVIVGLWACCRCWSAQLFLLGFRAGLSADGSGWRG